MKKFKKSLVEFTTLLVICSPLVAIADYMYWCYKWGLVSGKEVNRIMRIRGIRIDAPYIFVRILCVYITTNFMRKYLSIKLLVKE